MNWNVIVGSVIYVVLYAVYSVIEYKYRRIHPKIPKFKNFRLWKTITIGGAKPKTPSQRIKFLVKLYPGQNLANVLDSDDLETASDTGLLFEEKKIDIIRVDLEMLGFEQCHRTCHSPTSDEVVERIENIGLRLLTLAEAIELRRVTAVRDERKKLRNSQHCYVWIRDKILPLSLINYTDRYQKIHQSIERYMIRMNFDCFGSGKDIELDVVNPLNVWWQGCFFLCARDSELRPLAEIREIADKEKYMKKKRAWEQKRDFVYAIRSMEAGGYPLFKPEYKPWFWEKSYPDDEED